MWAFYLMTYLTSIRLYLASVGLCWTTVGFNWIILRKSRIILGYFGSMFDKRYLRKTIKKSILAIPNFPIVIFQDVIFRYPTAFT